MNRKVLNRFRLRCLHKRNTKKEPIHIPCMDVQRIIYISIEILEHILYHLDLATLLRLAIETFTLSTSTSTTSTTTIHKYKLKTDVGTLGLRECARYVLSRRLCHTPPLITLRFDQEDQRAYRVTFRLQAINANTGKLVFLPLLATGLRYKHSRWIQRPRCRGGWIVEWQPGWSRCLPKCQLPTHFKRIFQYQLSSRDAIRFLYTTQLHDVDDEMSMGEVAYREDSPWQWIPLLSTLSTQDDNMDAHPIQYLPPPAVVPDLYAMPSPEYRRPLTRLLPPTPHGSSFNTLIHHVTSQPSSFQHALLHPTFTQIVDTTAPPPPSRHIHQSTWRRCVRAISRYLLRRKSSSSSSSSSLPSSVSEDDVLEWPSAGWRANLPVGQDGPMVVCMRNTTLQQRIRRSSVHTPSRHRRASSTQPTIRDNQPTHTDIEWLFSGVADKPSDSTSKSSSQSDDRHHTWTTSHHAQCFLRYHVQRDRPNIGPMPYTQPSRRKGERWMVLECLVCDIAALTPPEPNKPSIQHSTHILTSSKSVI